MKASRYMALVAFAVIAFDQLSKYLILDMVEIAVREPIEVTSWFRLVMVWNQGISFGMLSAPETYVPYFLILVAVIISAVLARLGLRSTVKIEWLGYALVIGGALGNVVDRLRFGAVADFFYFHIGELGWPAFNVADACICIGVAILLVHSLFFQSKI